MPKMKVDEDTDIVSFSKEKIAQLDQYFTGTNAETAYLLGRYCGLRINECYGLKWENVDIEKGIILIDRQMQHQEGIIKLVPLIYCGIRWDTQALTSHNDIILRFPNLELIF